jgi:hypothetical protein
MSWAADTSNLVPAPYFGRGGVPASAATAASLTSAMAPALRPSFTFEPLEGVLQPGESMDLTVRACTALV